MRRIAPILGAPRGKRCSRTSSYHRSAVGGRLQGCKIPTGRGPGFGDISWDNAGYGFSHVGSGAFQGHPRYASRGMTRLPRRGTSRNVTGSHGIPREFTPKFPRKPSVGIHEIPWDVMGLGIGPGLGFSRALVGSHRKSWELAEKKNRDKLGVAGVSRNQTGTCGARGNSWEQKRQLASGIKRETTRVMWEPANIQQYCGMTSRGTTRGVRFFKEARHTLHGFNETMKIVIFTRPSIILCVGAW